MNLSKEQFYIYSERVAIMTENGEDETEARRQALKEALAWQEQQRS